MTGQTRVILAMLRGVLIAVGIGLAFVAGWWLRGSQPYVLAQTAPTPNPDRYALIGETQALLDQYYVKPQPDQTELTYGAIRGLLAALNDKFTFFIPPAVAASESNVFAGRYGGIGVQIKRSAQGDYVLYPFPDSPASAAGVQNGDILTQVNETVINSTSASDVVDQSLRGEVKEDAGIPNGVTIRVQREAQPEPLTFTIAFAEIQIPSLVYRVLSEDQRVGYIQILNFTARTPTELKEAIAALRAANIRGAVLDLRDNPGGLLEESVKVAGEFMSPGVILYEVKKDGEKTYQTDAEGTLTDLPLYVIVNGGTASAAELVAGALRDRGRASLIGQKTYGKGSIQYVLPLADKSSIHVTVAEWFPPRRGKLDGIGLSPDIAIVPDPSGVDVLLLRAISELAAKITTNE